VGVPFPSQAGTPLGHRNAQRRGLTKAARRAGLEDNRWPALRFHDLRHTFASHLIVDLRLDVAQVSRILGHAQITTTLSIYENPPRRGGFPDGARGTRTPDLLGAIQALSQLSYSPEVAQV
jgi:integrase